MRGLDESAPQIKANIEAAGIPPLNVRYLLNSHARLDQAGHGTFESVERRTGGRQPTNADPDGEGWTKDFALDVRLPFRPSPLIKLSTTGESISLGGITVTAYSRTDICQLNLGA